MRPRNVDGRPGPTRIAPAVPGPTGGIAPSRKPVRHSGPCLLARRPSLGQLCAGPVLGLGAMACHADAQEHRGADYFPRALGYSWAYVDQADPNHIEYEDVFESQPYGGYPEAWFVGSPDCDKFYVIEFNDGDSLLYLGGSSGCEGVDFEDVDLTTFEDGAVFGFGDPTDFKVVRLWENLDHNLTGEYGIDPLLTGVIVVVTYDTQEGPNDQNIILESGGGQTYDAAVTDIWFVRKSIGPIASINVDAASGAIVERYTIIASYDCNGNQIADHTDIEVGTSEDLDGNGVPDECEQCPPDLTGDGAVDTRDFLLFLGAWSQRDPLADWNGDGTINTQDFLAYLNDWVAGC